MPSLSLDDMPPLFVCVCGKIVARSQGLDRHRERCRDHVALRDAQLQHVYAQTPDESTDLPDSGNIDLSSPAATSDSSDEDSDTGASSPTTASTSSAGDDDSGQHGARKHSAEGGVVSDDEREISGSLNNTHSSDFANADDLGALELETVYETPSSNADGCDGTSTSAGSVSIGRGRLASSSGCDSAIRQTFEEVTARRAGTGIRKRVRLDTTCLLLS